MHDMLIPLRNGDDTTLDGRRLSNLSWVLGFRVLGYMN